MAVTDERWTLADAQWPEVNVAEVGLAYDVPTDTLFVDFYGRPLPAVNVPLAASEDIASLRVALDGDGIVGVEVERYLSLAPRRFPTWLALASHAGVPIRELQARGLHLTESVPRDDALARLLQDVRDAWVADIAAERLAALGTRSA